MLPVVSQQCNRAMAVSALFRGDVAKRKSARAITSPVFLGAPPIGGGVVETPLPNLSWVEHLAIDDTNAYWTEEGSGTGAVNKAPKAGGTITALATGQKFPRALLTYATDVYWTTSTNNGAVRAAPQTVGASRHWKHDAHHLCN